MQLLVSQKNQLFDIIVKNGLTPSLCEIYEDSDIDFNKNTYVKCKGTAFYFCFEDHNRTNSFKISFSPASDRFSLSIIVDKWPSVLYFFENWVQYLKREINAVDKWARLQDEISQLDISYTKEANKFSAAEYEDLKSKMQLLKSDIRELNLLSEQIEIIENKLDHLTELAITLNKFDWKGLFIGTIVSIILQFSFTPDNSKALWEIIKRVFNGYFINN